MDIEYKYNSRKLLLFIATEGDFSTVPGYIYLSFHPDHFSKIISSPVVCSHILDSIFNNFNGICWHISICNYTLTL